MIFFEYSPVLGGDNLITSVRCRPGSDGISKQTQPLSKRKIRVRNAISCCDRHARSSMRVLPSKIIINYRDGCADLHLRSVHSDNSNSSIVDTWDMIFSMISKASLLKLQPSLSPKLIQRHQHGCRKSLRQCNAYFPAQTMSFDTVRFPGSPSKPFQPPTCILVERDHNSALPMQSIKAQTGTMNYERSEQCNRALAPKYSSPAENLSEKFSTSLLTFTGAASQQQMASNTVSSGSTRSVATSAVLEGSQSIRRKRAHEDDTNGESGDDGKDSKRSRKGTPDPQDSGQDRIFFACPFRKHDPKKYNVAQWARCALTGHTSVARVKAHLYKYHLIFPCPRCKVLFKSQTLLDKHTVSSTRCDVADAEPVDGISPRLHVEIRSRKKAFKGQTEEDRWKQIYRLIFANEMAPSPYFEPIRDTEQEKSSLPSETVVLENYEQHFRQEFPKLFRLALEKSIKNKKTHIEDKIMNQLTDIVTQATDQALDSYKTKATSQAPRKVTERNDSGFYEPSLTVPYQQVPLSHSETSSELVASEKFPFESQTEGADTMEDNFWLSDPPSNFTLPSMSSYTEQADNQISRGTHFLPSPNRPPVASIGSHFEDPTQVIPRSSTPSSITYGKYPIFNPSNNIERYTGRSSTDLAIASLISPEPNDGSGDPTSQSAIAAWKQVLQLAGSPMARPNVRCGDLEVPDLAVRHLSRWMRLFAERRGRRQQL